jgi:hypothetical protein
MSTGKTSYILSLAKYDVVKYNTTTVIHNYKRSKKMNTTQQIAMYTLQLCSEKQKPTGDAFKNALIETIDESLSSFCNLDKEDVYLRLENTYKIKKQEIPCKIENFVDAIEQMFGVGAKLIEIKITAALHKRVPEFVFFPKEGDVDFKEYVTSLRAFMLLNL